MGCTAPAALSTAPFPVRSPDPRASRLHTAPAQALLSRLGLIPRRSGMLLFSLALAALLSGCATSGNPLARRSEGLAAYKEIVAYHQKKSQAEAQPVKSEEVDHERLGDVYFAQGNLDLAFLHYDKVLRAHPERLDIRCKKGLVYYARGLHQEALAEFQEVLKAQPDHGLANEGAGQVYLKLQNHDAAERHLKAALAADPKLWKSHMLLGILANLKNRPKEAAESFKEALALNPTAHFIHNNLGVAYMLAGDYDKATAEFRKALVDEGSQKTALNNMGIALFRLGRRAEALDAFIAAGTEASGYNNLGVLFWEEGNVEEAVHCFEKAVELDPGSFTKAGTNLRTARLQLNPAAPSAAEPPETPAPAASGKAKAAPRARSRVEAAGPVIRPVHIEEKPLPQPAAGVSVQEPSRGSSD